MIDPDILRNDPGRVVAASARRGVVFNAEEYTTLDNKRKVLQQKVQDLQSQRTKGAAEIAELLKKSADISEIKQKMQHVQQELKPAKQELDALLARLTEIHLNLPNLADESIPDGKDENDNRLEIEWGNKPNFKFKPKEHFELFPELMDFELASAMSGSRFVLLRGKIALLHRALAQMMLDIHIQEHGYEEINIPLILNRQTLINSGQLPKFEDDLFHVQENEGFLAPTSEVALVNLAANRIFKADELPLKVTCHSVCFRSEAGSYGKDVKGMLRQHQFEKVEMVQVTKPQDSDQALEDMSQHAQRILQVLEIPYRVVTLCCGDMGFAAAKTYDIEAWLPGQETYREISSCSNCRDFQARRMQARWLPDTGVKGKKGKTEPVHALNGSGLAVGRTLIAVLENYQTKDGNVRIPESLRPYLPGNMPEVI